MLVTKDGSKMQQDSLRNLQSLTFHLHAAMEQRRTLHALRKSTDAQTISVSTWDGTGQMTTITSVDQLETLCLEHMTKATEEADALRRTPDYTPGATAVLEFLQRAIQPQL